jgi:alanine racemase
LPAEREDVVKEGFIPVVSSTAEAKAYAHFAQGKPVRIHLCVDTGMGRIGVWQEEAIKTAQEIAALPGIEVESISTHLPVADSDPAFTAQELNSWDKLVAQLRPILPKAKFHALNSAASLERPQHAADRVRPGLALYGIYPLPAFQTLLKPVMTLKTSITLVRDVGSGRGISYGRDFITSKPMRIATLAMGYADGYPRQTSNKGGQVLIRGKRCPILGRITMDQLMVDATNLPRDVAPGEEVVLFGKQEDDQITVDEVAAWAGTITWDVLTRLGKRVALAHINAQADPR